MARSDILATDEKIDERSEQLAHDDHERPAPLVAATHATLRAREVVERHRHEDELQREQRDEEGKDLFERHAPQRPALPDPLSRAQRRILGTYLDPGRAHPSGADWHVARTACGMTKE